MLEKTKGSEQVSNKKKIKNLFADKPIANSQPCSKKRAVTVLSAYSTLMCVLSLLGFVLIKISFSDTDVVGTWIENNYAIGICLMTVLCAIQVVIVLIPGELLEIASGYAFGGFVGAVVCMVGILIGSIIAILLSRKYGRRLVEALYPREKIDALPILNNTKKRNFMTFLLYLIPGTPKDLLTYAVGMTGMSIPTYILLTTFARIPSVIISTIGGGALGDK